MPDTELFEYSRIFYGISAFFAVLAVLYFGFEYIQDLSPVTIAVIIVTTFASTFLRGATREHRGVKFLYYLVSAGSYLGFIAYINARLITTEDGILISLIFSAILFSGLGYLLTSKEEYLPEKNQAKKIIIVLISLMIALAFYDSLAVAYEQKYQLEEQIDFETDQETKIGYVETIKTGYLPTDIGRNRASFCATNGTVLVGLGGTSFGGELSSYTPETRSENLSLNYRPDMIDEVEGIEDGMIFEIKVVETCSRNEVNLETGQLGVEFDEEIEPSGLIQD